MSTETTEALASAAEGQTTQPELKEAALAQPQVDEAADQHSEEEDKGLSDEQKTIRKQQRRIDRLTAKRGAAEREAELYRQRLEAYERQQNAASQREEGDEEQKPKGRQFTEADIERMAQARAQELQRQASIGQRVSKVLEVGSKLEGFDSAVNALAQVVPFTDRQGRPSAFIDAVLDVDDQAGVLKYLGQNLDEAEDLADLTPAQLGRRLARLEIKLKASAKKETSAAPKPLKPVGGNNAGSEPDPSKMTDAQFAAWRKKQIEAKRGVGR